ncbi:MAG: DUF302 domain-containing protein [Hydrogenothermaceae bacterium]
MMLKIITLIALLISINFSSYANPLFQSYTSDKENFTESLEKLKSKLEEKGLKIVKVLPLSESVNSRGIDFDDYYIVVGCFDEKAKNILKNFPYISNLIPCSISIYKKDGKINISILNPDIFLQDVKVRKNLSWEEIRYIRNRYDLLKRSIISLGYKPINFYSKNSKNFKMKVMYEEVGQFNGPEEEFDMLLRSGLEGINMNVVMEMDLSLPDKWQKTYFICNLSYGAEILKSFPQFGSLAPCRINLYKSKEGYNISYINILELVSKFKSKMSEKEIDIFIKLDREIKEVLSEIR